MCPVPLTIFLGGLTVNRFLLHKEDSPATTTVEANATFLAIVLFVLGVVEPTLMVLPSLLQLGLVDRLVATILLFGCEDLIDLLYCWECDYSL